MKTLTVDLGDRSYPIFVGEGVLERTGETLVRLGCRSAPVVIADRRVARLHGEALLASIRGALGNVSVVRVPAGERHKDHRTLLSIYGALTRHKAHRDTWLVAFGGGVIGDLAGFAAATFLRGVPYIQVPTTLLAQVDSSVGGKVGINLPQGKNLVGAFYQPRAVLADTGVLRTLPHRELKAGLYEVIKSAAIASRPLFLYLEKEIDGILDRRPDALEHIVFETCSIKAGVVAADEREEARRMILNFGHTVGHALEAVTGYGRLRHGEGVAWGMLAALMVGIVYDRTPLREALRLSGLIRRLGPLPKLRDVSFASLWRAIERDKKFRGTIRVVFLSRIGKAEVAADLDPDSLRSWLREFVLQERIAVRRTPGRRAGARRGDGV